MQSDLSHTYTKGWKLVEVVPGGPRRWDGVEIRLTTDDSSIPENLKNWISSIKIGVPGTLVDTVLPEMEEFRDRKRDRLVFAHGLADIDFFRHAGPPRIVIVNSPVESQYHDMELASEEEFSKILDAVRTCAEKQSG